MLSLDLAVMPRCCDPDILFYALLYLYILFEMCYNVWVAINDLSYNFIIGGI